MLHNLIKWWTIWGPSKCPPHRATHSGRRDTLRAFKRRLRLEPLENRSLLATIMVTTEMDVVSPNDGLTSLREAIIQANDQTTNPGADTITFNSSLANKPVLLQLRQMTITDTVTIQGLGAAQTIIDGQNASRLFDITDTAGNVTFDGLTLTGGKTTADNEPGGAIRAATAISDKLTIQNSIVTGNSTTGTSSSGGGIGCNADGIACQLQLVLNNSTISANTTAGDNANGGGVSAFDLTITGSTISGNFTTGSNAGGGGVFFGQIAEMANSTVSSNYTMGSQSSGGGIFSQIGFFLITNSTISGNSTMGQFANGGGIFLNQVGFFPALFKNTTITGNSVAGTDASGGGIFTHTDVALGPVSILNSIVAGNSDFQDGSNPDLSGFLFDVQFSLIGNINGTSMMVPIGSPVGSPDANGNLIGTNDTPINPQLAPLANNGGPTQTHALCTAAGAPVANCTAVSPALNAGSNDLLRTAPAPTTDQRGVDFDRIFNTTVDMGSFESQPAYPWHNFVNRDDAVGSGTVVPDGHVVAEDVIAIINYINAKGSGPIPADAATGLPFGDIDTDRDNQVTADDVVTVINYINAHPGQSEAEATAASQTGAGNVPSDLISLLSMDIAEQVAHRRRLQ